MVSRKNAYLQRQKVALDQMSIIAHEVANQYFTDVLVLTLNDPEAMGGNAMGEARIRKFLAVLEERHNLYFDALLRGPEQDYYREKLDEALKQIVKTDFLEFEKRYPQLRQTTTGGAKNAGRKR